MLDRHPADPALSYFKLSQAGLSHSLERRGACQIAVAEYQSFLEVG